MKDSDVEKILRFTISRNLAEAKLMEAQGMPKSAESEIQEAEAIRVALNAYMEKHSEKAKQSV